MCLINDYSLIADLHIFVYGRAECTTISLECTKVKLLILNDFDFCSLNLINANLVFKLPKAQKYNFVFCVFDFI